MFWKFNFPTSQIDNLLEREDVTLEELLDEDDVLQECKAQNKRLIDFLIKPEIIEELVNLVIKEPPEDLDDKVKFKYPNTACEVLTSDVMVITDALANQSTLLNKIYSFLENEDPLNPLQASFVSKIMGLLINRKSEVMLEFLKSKEDFVGHLLQHIDTSAIMDLLLRLITCIEVRECQLACINWLSEEKIIQKLVGLIDPAHSEEKHCNASQVLCDIIRIVREQMSQLQERADNDPLLAAIESEETISDLLCHMFDSQDQKVESVMSNGLAVLQGLLEFRKLGVFYFSGEGCQEQMTALDNERLEQGISNTIKAVTPRLKDFHKLLLEPPKQHYNAMPTTAGTLQPPLGNTRLQICKLVATLLLTNNQTVNQELTSLGTISVILDLHMKYVWNNFLHTQVEVCTATVLHNAPTGEENPTHPLLNQLFTDINIIEKIIEAWEDNDSAQSRPNGHRRGFMGHLNRIANHVTESMEKGTNSERIKELVENLSEDLRKKWETFTSGPLADLNKRNTVELVSSNPLHSSSEDDDDFRDIAFPQETAMQQAFSDYQLQQMTSNFIDQFGFNEDEFSEQQERVDAPFTNRISSINFDVGSEDNATAQTMFEQACSERMQQFDDPDSDEEIWEEKEITFSNNTRQSTVDRSAARHSSGEDEEQDSSDSEDELQSPRQIFQTPPAPSSNETASGEKMDVDSSDNWATFDSVTSSTPVAMDTGAAWAGGEADTGASTKTSSSENGEAGWAKFDEGQATSSSDNPEAKAESTKEEEWDDFKSFEDSKKSPIKSKVEPHPNTKPVEYGVYDYVTSTYTTPPPDYGYTLRKQQLQMEKLESPKTAFYEEMLKNPEKARKKALEIPPALGKVIQNAKPVSRKDQDFEIFPVGSGTYKPTLGKQDKLRLQGYGRGAPTAGSTQYWSDLFKPDREKQFKPNPPPSSKSPQQNSKSPTQNTKVKNNPDKDRRLSNFFNFRSNQDEDNKSSPNSVKANVVGDQAITIKLSTKPLTEKIVEDLYGNNERKMLEDFKKSIRPESLPKNTDTKQENLKKDQSKPVSPKENVKINQPKPISPMFPPDSSDSDEDDRDWVEFASLLYGDKPSRFIFNPPAAKRDASPVAMETSEQPSSTRTAAYMVESADNAVQSSTDAQTNEAEPSNPPSAPKEAWRSIDTTTDKPQEPSSSTPTPQSPQSAPDSTTDQSFLASSGLMKSSEPAAAAESEESTESELPNSSTSSDKLEEIRQQAKEALNSFNEAALSSSSSTNSSENGPV